MRTSKNDDLPLHVVISLLDVSTSDIVRAVVVRATASCRGVSLNKAVDYTSFVVLFFSRQNLCLDSAHYCRVIGT